MHKLFREIAHNDRGKITTERRYVRRQPRTYVRVYELYGWGRGDYQKEGRGVSGVSWQVHIFNIGF